VDHHHTTSIVCNQLSALVYTHLLAYPGNNSWHKMTKVRNLTYMLNIPEKLCNKGFMEKGEYSTLYSMQDNLGHREELNRAYQINFHST